MFPVIKHALYEAYHTPRRRIANILDEPAVVLLYHRVAVIDSDPQQLCVAPEHFYAQIEYAQKNCHVLTAEEFVYILSRKEKFPPRSLLLTFDDGYADNYLHALPILESLGAHAIFYIATGLLDSQVEFWWDALDHVFFEPLRFAPVLNLTLNNRSLTYSTGSQKERTSVYHQLHRLLKYSLPADRMEIIQQALQWAKLPATGRSSHRVLRSTEVQGLAHSRAATIGAHTHTHTPLNVLSHTQQQEDIRQSKEILESLLHAPVTHFSYPYGLKKDYNAISMALCKQFGFSMVCSNYYDQVHSWTDRWQIPRILVRNWPLDVFKLRLEHFFRA